jgi:hypothetical protein
MILRVDMKTHLTQRRAHEKKGCVTSKTGIVDDRCEWCKGFDRWVHSQTAVGWAPTDFDRAFLATVGISSL